MSALETLTLQLASGRHLLGPEVALAAEALSAAEVPVESKTAFLAALADKGETAEEVAAFATEFRARAVDPGVERWAAEAIDVVGTGGDRAGGFNVSSLVVLVLASAGLTVMKHGNRGVTSRCGSAELMAALGYDLEAPPQKLRDGLAKLGYVFFFAPAFHPAFRHVGPARKALAAQGRRSVFNILGPLVNPGRPGRILLGVYAASWVPKLAGALDRLGTEAGLAVHGSLGPDAGIDEFTTATVNHVQGIGRIRGVQGRWTAADVGLPPAPFDAMKGGDVQANLELTEAILSGRAPKGLEDTIVANAAIGMWICGATAAPGEGVGAARELLLGGAVRRKLADTRDFFRSP